MRTIKFRGKNGLDKWVYGSLVSGQSDNGTDVCFIAESLPVGTDDFEHWNLPMQRVKPETVGQYIGRNDCNSTPIYEGDIITVNGKYPKLVRYIDEWHSFCVANLDAITDPCMSRWPDVCNYQQPSPNWWNDFKREIKVIANAHDNPELVKAKEV